MYNKISLSLDYTIYLLICQYIYALLDKFNYKNL